LSFFAAELSFTASIIAEVNAATIGRKGGRAYGWEIVADKENAYPGVRIVSDVGLLPAG
jgi:hypothetical protein